MPHRVVGVNARTGQISLSLSLLSSRRFQAVSVPQMGCLSSVVAFVPHLGVSVVEDSRQWGQASVSHLGLPSCPVWGCVVRWSSCAPVGVLRTGFPLSPLSLFCLVEDSRQCPLSACALLSPAKMYSQHAKHPLGTTSSATGVCSLSACALRRAGGAAAYYYF